MMVMGLTTGLWVSAQVRLCDRAFIPATVVRRGDPDAGTVLVKLNRFEAGRHGLHPGEHAGRRAGLEPRHRAPRRSPRPRPTPTSPARSQYDPDVWVLEIEDRKGAYKLDGKIV